ncbi:MAG TPA: aldolase/citrate lyase family protein [Nitrospiraceae bacterium]|nr:aldolase/citrate lyase family protein [Nitrospiraceae bacterium]
MHHFDLFLFSTDCDFIPRAVAAGVAGVIVDWEHIGKDLRQAGADTQINHDTVDDLLRVRACTDARILCRINGHGATTRKEIELAIIAGADEILLPMVRTVREVESVLEQVGGRCEVGIQIETRAALNLAAELSSLPLSRVYVGLNDLALERKSPNIFTPILDGTIEAIRPWFDIPFGVMGLTSPDRGFPIPSRLLMAELVRLRCDFSMLRRSFHRDLQGRDPAIEIPRIHHALRLLRLRPPGVVAGDRHELESAILNWPNPLPAQDMVLSHVSRTR